MDDEPVYGSFSNGQSESQAYGNGTTEWGHSVRVQGICSQYRCDCSLSGSLALPPSLSHPSPPWRPVLNYFLTGGVLGRSVLC
eukprot:3868040-Rhodomonas_salina.2